MDESNRDGPVGSSEGAKGKPTPLQHPDALASRASDAPTVTPAPSDDGVAARIGEIRHSLTRIALPADEDTRARIDDLLAEVEDDGSLAEKIQKQKEDIEKTRSFMSAYNELRVGQVPGKKLSGATRGKIDSLKAKEYNGETIKALADEPDRLAAVLDSIDAHEGVLSEVKREVKEYILRQAAKHVETTAGTVDPDIIAQRLTVSLKPGSNRELLQRTLLKSYFQAAETNPTEVVVDNFERFVQGIARISDQPQVAQAAVDIAEFKTDVLPQGELYQYQFTMTSGVRVDRPDILARYMGTAKAIKLIKIHTSGLSSAAQNPDRGFQIPQIQERFGSFLASEQGRAIESLGQTEYERRQAIMQGLVQQSVERGVAGTVSKDKNQKPNWIVGLDYASGYREYRDAEIYCETHPDARDFLMSVLNSESKVIEELPSFFTVPSIISESAGAMVTGTDSESTKMATLRTGDGFVLQTQIGTDVHEPDDIGWQNVLQANREQIDNAKVTIRSAIGLNRRHDSFIDPSSGQWFVLRPENAEDLKPYHPIDALLDHEMTDNNEQESLADIEAARNMVAEERNRFFNERGIVVIYDNEEDSSSRAIELRKHPRNPKALIVTVRDSAADGTTKEARILMDPDLRFQLGSKKVRSPQALLALNAVTADIVAAYRCQIPLTVEGDDGEKIQLGEGKNAVEDRIAHLRLLTLGQHRGDAQWLKCVDIEGDDLDVLAGPYREKKFAEGELDARERSVTYVEPKVTDDPNKGPLRIYLDSAA